MATFKVIIVGGGPTGLCMGHALSLAGIDYVILERNSDVAEPGSGASLALWPHSARLLDQLGLLDDVRRIAMTMKEKRNHGPDGKELSRNNMFECVEKNHGYPWMMFHRSKLLELLYEKLPGREFRVKTDKKLKSIETLPTGVRVRCEDGTIEDGSIVVGCDGVHSRTRQLLLEMALRAGTKLPDLKAPPMQAEYQALFGHVARRHPDLNPATVYEVRNTGSSFHILVGPDDDVYFFAYTRLPRPTAERRHYTDAEANELAETMRDRPLTETLNFGDLWDSRSWAVLADLQEGFAQTWHWGGRVVLVGDAVHKMTPNAGFSLNTAWQGVAELTNRLWAVVQETEQPDAATLTRAFAQYQSGREGLARQSGFCSSLYTRTAAWQNLLLRACDVVAPYVGGDVMLLNAIASPVVARGITLNFVPEPHHRSGRLPWKNAPTVVEEVCEKDAQDSAKAKVIETTSEYRPIVVVG